MRKISSDISSGRVDKYLRNSIENDKFFDVGSFPNMPPPFEGLNFRPQSSPLENILKPNPPYFCISNHPHEKSESSFNFKKDGLESEEFTTSCEDTISYPIIQKIIKEEVQTQMGECIDLIKEMCSNLKNEIDECFVTNRFQTISEFAKLEQSTFEMFAAAKRESCNSVDGTSPSRYSLTPSQPFENKSRMFNSDESGCQGDILM